MNLLIWFLTALALIAASIVIWLFYRGKKEKKRQSEWEKKRRSAKKQAQTQKEHEEFLKKNLSVKGVTKSSDFHKKYSGKKKYQKVPTK